MKIWVKSWDTLYDTSFSNVFPLRSLRRNCQAPKKENESIPLKSIVLQQTTWGHTVCHKDKIATGELSCSQSSSGFQVVTPNLKILSHYAVTHLHLSPTILPNNIWVNFTVLNIIFKMFSFSSKHITYHWEIFCCVRSKFPRVEQTVGKL